MAFNNASRLTAIFLLISLLTFGGCQLNKNSKKPTVSGISADIEVLRLEQDLYNATSDSMPVLLANIQAQYPAFFPFYVERMMGFGSLEHQPELTQEKLRTFLNDQYIREVMEECKKQFPDTKNIESELEHAFRYFKYYYPNKTIPKVVTFTANFGWAGITFDTTILGIGLDMYLGANYKYYPSLFPQYISQKFEKQYLVSNTMKAFAGSLYEFEPDDNTLLSAMVTEGKRLYFLDLVLPDTPDHLKLEYLEKDVVWCVQNESEIWNYFIENDLLYSTEQMENDRFLKPAPSISGMPPEAPGRIGAWMGLQIVRKFMQEKPEITYDELATGYNAQAILTQSRYKPRRSFL